MESDVFNFHKQQCTELPHNRHLPTQFQGHILRPNLLTRSNSQLEHNVTTNPQFLDQNMQGISVHFGAIPHVWGKHIGMLENILDDDDPHDLT